MIVILKSMFNVSFPNMEKIVENYLSNCKACVSNNLRKTGIWYTYKTVESIYPNSLSHIDVIHMKERSINGYKYVLMILDDFTRFCILLPLKEHNAIEIAKRLLFTNSRCFKTNLEFR
jgi:hypothetical protein